MLNKAKLMWSKTNRWHRVLLIFVIVETKLLPGGQVGFECNDPSLSYPYTGDTVSWKWLLGITIFLPLAVMLLVERNLEKSETAKKQALSWYKEYLYGLLINLTLVQSVKFLVGSPRPHFFDTCRPKEAQTCKPSDYVTSYTCTKAHWLNQSDRSFPSGHTSLAFHAGLFIAYYLYQRGSHVTFRWTLATQLLSVFGASYCAVSRMTDHRHHWWDVLAGLVLAVAILVYTIIGLCNKFECTVPKNESSTEDQTKAMLEDTKESIVEST